ncbi:glycine cleavage system protein GcvH [Actinokineospora sp. NBRC 105648]|uniref:glycine cleavage system protein GcvH n=1 Tax=Actinokineospora sp. NBRC 105648 TaxID=3032206 RepID=UPI0024A2DE94|nr:glycine cleavage system protein GcvH [Actinokineospora sp. NBRC 105648]GLZ36775.1 glycine cleavage system H protein [Actinokineospora sp. NBRC 105648]
MIPEELRYTDEHEWVASKTEDLVRVGITDYAQQQLGDVVHVQLPEVGDRVEAGTGVGEVESTKSVSDLFAPLSGEVVAVNDALLEQTELLNSDPYGEGWLFEIRLDDPDALEALLDADAYQALTAG